MDNYIGKMLDNRYEILEVIGIGGMAVVYKARCHRLNRLVAIKILKDEFSQDAEFRRRFHAESQAVAMLSHPNIVSVYDVSHSGDADYIVMELIDGITLKQYMEQKGQLNWRETLHFATQIAKALEHAHSRGIIHRDIKPHNIMILKDGSVKVADFGIARITSAQSTLTREALGSVHYISPEQARGSRVDKRSDLYSLGVVMYEMLTGRPPFDGDSPVAVAIQHINGTPVLPTELNPSIPKGLEQITMHAMTAAVDKRYESATDMLADLEEFRKNPNVVFDFSSPAVPEQPAAYARNSGAVETPVAEQPQPVRRQPRPQPQPQRQAERVEEQEKSKGNRVAVIAGVVCVALAAIGIFFFLYNSFLKDLFTPTEEIEVPSLVGEMYEDVAANETYKENFKLVPTWVEDEAEFGTIIDQSPEAGSSVKVGSSIKLTVSQGMESDEPQTMPNLVGQSLEYAQNVLTGMNMSAPQVTRTYDDKAPKDTVISTDPEEGEPLTVGQTVTLVVSDGPEEEPVKVPELKGKDVDEAIKTLTEAGLTPGSVDGKPDSAPEGTVIYQSVNQGDEVPKGTVVNLIYSNGPEEDPDDPDEQNPDEGQSPDEGGTTDPGTGDEPVTEPGTSTIEVDLPTDRSETLMTVTVDGVPVGEPQTVETSQGTISITVQGSGKQLVDVYFDGVRGWSGTIDFGS